MIMTLAGKLGDALLQWPVAYHWCLQNHQSCTLWLDEKSLKPLVPLFEAQPCVDQVILKPGIEHYRCGGQPWDFGVKTEDHLEDTIIHLGMRSFPTQQITLQTLEWVPLSIRRDDLADTPTLKAPSDRWENRLVLHGTFTSHVTGVPGFWKFLFDHEQEFQDMFERIVFVGPREDTARALELYPQWEAFDDQGNFLTLASLLQDSRLVVGSGSSVAALGGCLKVPTVRVHDPIGEAPRCIWSNLGRNQINETEPALRKGAWSEFKKQWLAPKIEATGTPQREAEVQ